VEDYVIPLYFSPFVKKYLIFMHPGYGSDNLFTRLGHGVSGNYRYGNSFAYSIEALL